MRVEPSSMPSDVRPEAIWSRALSALELFTVLSSSSDVSGMMLPVTYLPANPDLRRVHGFAPNARLRGAPKPCARGHVVHSASVAHDYSAAEDARRISTGSAGAAGASRPRTSAMQRAASPATSRRTVVSAGR